MVKLIQKRRREFQKNEITTEEQSTKAFLKPFVNIISRKHNKKR